MGITPQYFWLIISSVGGCEKVQEVQELRLLKNPLVVPGSLLTPARPAGIILCTAHSLNSLKLNYILWLPAPFYNVASLKGKSILSTYLTECSENTKIIHHLLNTRQSGYSSNKNLRWQSRLHLLRDKLGFGKWEKVF